MSAAKLMVCLLLCLQDVSSWSHVSNSRWSEEFPACAGHMQSPIDLPDACKPGSGVIVDTSLRVEYSKYEYDLPEDRLDLVNSGHTLSCKLRGSDESPNDGSPGVWFNGQFFQFSELHFHWDMNDTEGSDHTLSGQRLATEVHLVHYNTKYHRMDIATGKPDGLLVLGILLTAQNEPNPALVPLTDKIDDVIQPHSPTFLQSAINLSNLLPERKNGFYVYSGSLTTPPCTQPVEWVVFRDTGVIGFGQLADLERLSGGEDKKRDIQPRNDRMIAISDASHCQ